MKPTPNTALKVAIVQSQLPQHEVARRARIRETRLSHIVRGRVEPTEEERERLAKLLRRSQDELFPQVAA